MDFRKMNNNELEVSFHQAVKSERNIMHLVILHLQEIDRRKLFLGLGYASLFDYLVNGAKYSAASAQRRIEAARLMNEVPTISDKLQSGDLNLSQIGEIQKSVKHAERVHQVKVDKSTKAALVEQVLKQDKTTTQQICATSLNIPVIEDERVKTQKDKSRRIELTLTEEQFDKFEKIKGLLAHKNLQKRRTQSMNDILETLFDEVLDKSYFGEYSKKEVSANGAIDRNKRGLNNKSISAAEIQSTHPNAEKGWRDSKEVKGSEKWKDSEKWQDSEEWNCLTPKRKRTILAEDQCCQYENPETGKICGSTFNLHVDHIQPRQFGGRNNAGNLRVLCRAHNLYRVNRNVVH